MCGTRLAANTGRKKVAKNRHLATIAQLCRAISSQLRHVSTIGKKLVKQQYLLYMSPQYGELQPTIGWDRFVSLGVPHVISTGFTFVYVTAATSLNGSQPNFALCLAVSWPGTLYIHFRYLLPPDGILPRAKFTLCPSMHHRTSFSGYIFAIKASIDNRKKSY